MSYKVKKGDTLSKIAKENNMSLDELLKLNGISKDKANDIRIGQEIKITKDQNPVDLVK
jgi:LysM repeat protein